MILCSIREIGLTSLTLQGNKTDPEITEDTVVNRNVLRKQVVNCKTLGLVRENLDWRITGGIEAEALVISTSQLLACSFREAWEEKREEETEDGGEEQSQQKCVCEP